MRANRLANKPAAQIFYGDAFAGFIMFSLAVVMFFLFNENLPFSEDRILDSLVGDAESISSTLMTSGIPSNWTPDYVSAVGLTDGSYRLNATKASMLMNTSYNVTNAMFGTNANYIIFFKDKNGNVLLFDRCAFSNSGIVGQNISLYTCENITAPNATQIVTAERLLFYDSGIIKLTVYAWV